MDNSWIVDMINASWLIVCALLIIGLFIYHAFEDHDFKKGNKLKSACHWLKTNYGVIFIVTIFLFVLYAGFQDIFHR